MLLINFLTHVCQLIKQANKKKVSGKCVRMKEILKDAVIKKEIDDKFVAYEKQLKFKYIKLMN